MPVLATLQSRLAALYDLETRLDVDDFVCDDETARAIGGEDATRRGEVLFVVEHGDEARVALWLEPGAREAASLDAWLEHSERFRACCLAAEGVSHFVLIAFRAEHADPVSELELELQAEIDKWALGLLAPFDDADRDRLLAGHGVGLVALRDRSRRLRERLFGEVAYLDAAGTERGDRYRAATRLAARYVRALEHRHVENGRIDALARELRRFYRLGARQKIEASERRLDGRD